jgi:hypothetical protein
MQRVRDAALRVVKVSLVVTALTSTGCTTWTTGDGPSPSQRLYRNNGGYVPNPVNHDFGSGGP